MGDDPGLADFLGPPAHMREPVLHRSGRQALSLPALHQGVHMLTLERIRCHLPKAGFTQLASHHRQPFQSVALRGMASISVAPAKLP
ncbi:hypothetical protein D9M71_567360 [compost metagenome]